LAGIGRKHAVRRAFCNHEVSGPGGTLIGAAAGASVA
jgi:hypothetical protein